MHYVALAALVLFAWIGVAFVVGVLFVQLIRTEPTPLARRGELKRWPAEPEEPVVYWIELDEPRSDHQAA